MHQCIKFLLQRCLDHLTGFTEIIRIHIYIYIYNIDSFLNSLKFVCKIRADIIKIIL